MTAQEALDRLTRAVADVGGDVPCRGDDRWYSDDHRVRAQVAEHCTACPVLIQCRTYATTAGERFGVWGGHDFTHTTTRKETAA